MLSERRIVEECSEINAFQKETVYEWNELHKCVFRM